ncbi:hypothetical protein RSOLAG1IB_10946 [Rhizoctonia solani AG-1 IB]|uniref:Protein kinase domain-containing protein n=1 Tax=Thanatephorus cucumeris (strain AG1-IB / isolate 7/3/14) TaxID=1108050 RepID=A0A0B7G632_THACB|nr:hypothetical protein RSOLAG1IB_10946 [Rhizoctonia solani AG-1 IB]
MSCSEVLTLLTRHGCADLTSSLHRNSFAAYPIATGGVGDVYRGQLIDNKLIAIKTIRLYGEGHSHESG